MLEPGALVWVMAPGYGYVGVGRVQTEAMPFSEFQVVGESGAEEFLKDQPLQGRYQIGLDPSVDDDSPDTMEYCVGIRWLHTVPLAQAHKRAGLFGNQNSVCRPRTPKWAQTVSELKALWKPNLNS